MGNGGPDETVYFAQSDRGLRCQLAESRETAEYIDNRQRSDVQADLGHCVYQNNVQSISLRCGWYCMQLKKWEKYDLQDNETVFDSYEAEPVRLQRTLFAIWVIYRGGKSVGYFQS